MKFFIFFLVFFLFLVIPSKILASSYVLPYPGVMPGNKLYFVYEFIDNVKKYAAFGDFASFSHALSQSDKYLVESKTLFEYGQYPLAISALKKSNLLLTQAELNLIKAKKNKKNITEKNMILISAKEKHKEVLVQIEKTVPHTFIWDAEDADPVLLNLRKELNQAIKLR